MRRRQKYKHRAGPNRPSPERPRSTAEPATGASTHTRHLVVEYFLPLLVLSTAFLLVFHPALRAELDLIDDHEILRFASSQPVHPDLPASLGPAESVWHIAVTRDISQGRFRPVYYFHRFAEIALLGHNSAAWHAVRLSMGIITCFLFYLAARRLNMTRWVAALFLAWLALQGGSTEIWVRLGPCEALGMLMLSFTVFAITLAARSGKPGWWDVGALIGMALMGWSKETFVMVIPALLMLRLVLQCRFHPARPLRSLVSVAVPLLIGSIIFVVQVSTLLWILNRGGVGADIVNQTGNPFSLSRWAALLWLFRARFASYLPLGVILLLFAYDLIKRRRVNTYVLAGLLIGLAWIIPQLLTLIPFWAPSRYAYPLVVALAALNAFALNEVGRRDSRLLLVCWIICGYLTAPFLVSTSAYAASFASQTVALNRMTDHVAEHVNPNQAVVLYAHPAHDFEATISLVFHLGAKGVTSQVYLHPGDDYDDSDPLAVSNMAGQFRGRVDTTALSDAYRHRLESSRNISLGADLSADDVSIVIVLTPEDVFENKPPKWFQPELYNALTVSEPRYISRGFSRKKDGAFTYRMLQKRAVATNGM